MSIETISQTKCFDGTQYIFAHDSIQTKTKMRFAAYVPDLANSKELPVVYFLSGLTCTEENFTHKAGAQRIASSLGLILIMPDTSPRGENVPDDANGAYDFGLGAGFYVDATIEPFAKNYKMRSYIEKELPELIANSLNIAPNKASIMGHSMGGHGALTIALRNPNMFKSVSAFAPISSPINCPWGQKALTGYIGPQSEKWREYDACALLEDGCILPPCLIDQGMSDNFLFEQLKPELLEAAATKANAPLQLRRQAGYDHSYYFISTFIEEHLLFHSRHLQ